MSFMTILSSDALTALGATLIVVTYGFAIVRLTSRLRERRNRQRTELFNTISSGLKNKTLTTIDDFVNVYKGIKQIGADDVSYKGELSRVLRAYLVKIISDSSLQPQEAIASKEIISSLLTQIEAEAPFAEVPPTERNLITDILKFIKSGDKDGAQQKLVDLAGHIETRQDAMIRLQSVNKWSTGTAVVGLILTVGFGVLSFIR